MIYSKFALLFSLLLLGAFARAESGPAPIAEISAVATTAPPHESTVAPTCSARMAKYVVAGSLTSKAIGARTWSLSRLAHDAKSSDSCIQKLYKRAVHEETAYWKHIRDKYKCSDETERLAVSATCSQQRLDQVKLNLSWLKLFKYADDDVDDKSKTEAAVCDEKCQNQKASEPLSEANQRDLHATVRALVRALPDTTHASEAAEHAPPKPAAAVVRPKAAPLAKPVAATQKALSKKAARLPQVTEAQYYAKMKANPKGASAFATKRNAELLAEADALENNTKPLMTDELIASQNRVISLRAEIKELDKAFKRIDITLVDEAHAPEGPTN